VLALLAHLLDGDSQDDRTGVDVNNVCGRELYSSKFDDWSDPGYLGIPSPVVNKTMLAPTPIDVPPFFAARISRS